MEINEMTLDQIEARKLEIKALVDDESSEADFKALETELDGLEERKAFLLDEQRKADMKAVLSGEGKEITFTELEETHMTRTLEEVRSSKEYVDAYVEYLKTEDDKECRALLTELVSDGQVPVPSIVESEIRTAWENSEILSRVRKSYVDGIVCVGFELSATGAVVHTEGAAAPSEEELTIGIVSLTPASIKKWITISDEAIDLTGEAFLRYIYDELTYQITKKIEDEIIAIINAAPAASTKTAVGIASVTAAPALGTMASALAELSSQATDLVAIMNRKTWAAFKAAQYAANFAQDIFEGVKPIFNDTLADYASATGTYMIVGDLRAVQANFPKGEGVTIKYDDKSLAEKDLVKVVGREYVGLGVTAPKMLVKVAKAANAEG